MVPPTKIVLKKNQNLTKYNIEEKKSDGAC